MPPSTPTSHMRPQPRGGSVQLPHMDSRRLAAMTIGEAMRTCGTSGGPAIACVVIIPATSTSLTLTEILTSFASAGLADAAAQFAFAAGDTRVMTPGSVLQAEAILRHIEEVFEDLEETEHPSFHLLDHSLASDWAEGASLARRLLTAHASAFRVKRSKTSAQAATTDTQRIQVTVNSDKPPAGSYKLVTVAPAAAVPGASSPEIIDQISSDAVVRTELLRASAFANGSTSTGRERDTAVQSELQYWESTYGQPALAYLLSNGHVTSAISGVGVPTALHNLRTHLLSGGRQIITEAMGEERAACLFKQSSSLAVSFLTGATDPDECVALLGGSAPHPDAEIDTEGGAVASGTLGTHLGDAGQYSIREAFRLWGGAMGRTFGLIPGVDAGPKGDFDMESTLKSIPRALSVENLMSLCRFICSRLASGLLHYRRESGRKLPDLLTTVTTAGSKVYAERKTDQRLSARVEASLVPLQAEIIQLRQEVARRPLHGKPAPATIAATATTATAQTTAQLGTKPPRTNRLKAALVDKPPADSTAAPAPAAKDALSAELKAALTPTAASVAFHEPPVVGTVARKSALKGSPIAKDAKEGDGKFRERIAAMVSLNAKWRETKGVPTSEADAAKEPCAYAALFGTCGAKDCKRCKSGLTFPKKMVDEIIANCDPRVFEKKTN